MRKINEKGYDFIKSAEGLKLTSYKDIAGVWTIGYGNTKYEDGSSVGPNQTITKEQADKLLRYKFDKFAKRVDSLVKSKINENQFAALTSLAYNIGESAFSTSTVIRRVNNNPEDKEGIAQAFLMWVKITDPKTKQKITSQGLVNRRKKEVELYRS